MYNDRVSAADLWQLLYQNIGVVAVAGENKVVVYDGLGGYKDDVPLYELQDGDETVISVDATTRCGGYGFPIDICGWDSDGHYVAIYCYEADMPRFLWYE